MKKYFSIMVAVALGLVATVSLAACGGDDDDSEAKKAACAEIEYNVTLSDDIVKYYDIDVEYTGLKEKAMTEQLTTNKWTLKRGSSTKLPVTFKYKFNFALKSGKELPASINLAYSPKVTVSVFNSTGKQLRKKSLTIEGTPQTNLSTADYDPNVVLNKIHFEYTVPADGTLNDIEK